MRYTGFVQEQVIDVSTSLWDIILKEEENMSMCLGIFLPQKCYKKSIWFVDLFNVDRETEGEFRHRKMT